jgi:hypothetical protein
MPVVYADLIETGGAGSSRALLLAFALGFGIIVFAFLFMLVHLLRVI